MLWLLLRLRKSRCCECNRTRETLVNQATSTKSGMQIHHRGFSREERQTAIKFLSNILHVALHKRHCDAPNIIRDEVFKNCRSKTDQRIIRMNRESKSMARQKYVICVQKSSSLFRFGLKFAVQQKHSE